MTESRARVAHIGIAVPSIDAALGFYRDVLGLEPGRPETADGATIVGLPLGDVQVELLEPRVPRGQRLEFPRGQLWHSAAGLGKLARSVPTTSQRPSLVRASSIGTTTVQDVERCSSTRSSRRSSLFGTGSGPSTTR